MRPKEKNLAQKWRVIHLTGLGLIGISIILLGCHRNSSIQANLPADIKPQLVELLENNDLTEIQEPAGDQCARVVVLMYHHVEEYKKAKEEGFEKLNVTPYYFRQHLQQLKNEGYVFIGPSDLINYFDWGSPLPPKAVLMTFDDAYEDNYRIAWPIMKEFGVKSVIFIPTGLTSNPDYLSWRNIKAMSSDGLVYFGNHTWSHHGSKGSRDVLDKEIGTAHRDLSRYGLNRNLVFAYPYGQSSQTAREILKERGYKLAFTTRPGTLMCRSNRLELPRLRAGNTTLDLSR